MVQLINVATSMRHNNSHLGGKTAGRPCLSQVGEEDQGLECEICKKWWHSGCVDIQDSEYEMLARHCKGTIHWYCQLCNGKTLQMMKLIQELNEKLQKRA